MSGSIKVGDSPRLVAIRRWPNLWTSFGPKRIGLVGSINWAVVLMLTLLVVMGLALRLNRLSEIGFAEDEMNKLDAIAAYSRGDFSANAEHPMLMKALMLLSLRAAPRVAEESALRFPNALIGALTVIPIFLLTCAFFDRWTALLAAAFWSLGINAITHNRIGKEDTLLVFFMLFGFYFFLRAKQTSPLNKAFCQRHYIASAVSFGLMIASKYFPHYFGLNMLFHHNSRAYTPKPGEPAAKTPRLFYLLIVIVFVVASPVVLMPHVWEYMNAYMGERLLTHSGYLFAGHLYKNNMSSSPFSGTPFYFYLLFLAVKVPLLILAGFLLGLVVCIKHRRELGPAFLLFMLFFWIVPYSLIGAKWLRYTLSLMPFVYMASAVGVLALVRWFKSRPKNRKELTQFATLAVVAVFVFGPAWIAWSHGPHFALYTNALAADKAGFFFPHDEFYDDGLREAIKVVCARAPVGATIAHETPAVVRHYLASFGRTDLRSCVISSPEFDPRTSTGPIYVLAQSGRTYFENRDELGYVRSHFRKVNTITVAGLTAVEIFVNR